MDGLRSLVLRKQLSLTVSEMNASLDRTLPTIDNDARRRYVALDLNRLDGLLETFYKRALEKADTQAGLLVVKIIERRALLLGLDRPQKLDVTQIRRRKRRVRSTKFARRFQNRAMLLTTEKIRALVDNIRGKKDRIIDGEVVKKDDGDG